MKKYSIIIFILVLAIIAEAGYIIYLRKTNLLTPTTNTIFEEENVVSNILDSNELENTLNEVDTNEISSNELENTSELENLLTYSNTIVKEPETYEEVIFPTGYSLDKVLVSIKNSTATKGGLTLVIKDLNMEKPVFTENYKLLYKAGSVWADYPYLDSNYKFSQDLMFGEDYVFEQTIDWRDVYGELKPGTYKIEKTQKINGKYLRFTSPEFKIN